MGKVAAVYCKEEALTNLDILLVVEVDNKDLLVVLTSFFYLTVIN